VSDVVVRRVLVALDASEPGRAALEAATVLADRIGAEVAALFVEDEDLLRLAGLPRATAFSVAGARPRALDPVSMGRELRIVGERLRRAVEDAASRLRVRATFRATRGRVEAEFLAAAREADLVVIGRRGQNAGPGALGSTARAVALSGRAVLLIAAEERLEAPVVVAVDGTAEGDAALDLAIAVARAARGRLVALAVRGAAASPQDVVRRTEERLRDLGIEAQVRPVGRGDAASLCAATRAVEGHTLVLPLHLTHDGDLEACIANAPGPVVLVGRLPG